MNSAVPRIVCLSAVALAACTSDPREEPSKASKRIRTWSLSFEYVDPFGDSYEVLEEDRQIVEQGSRKGVPYRVTLNSATISGEIFPGETSPITNWSFSNPEI